MCSASSQAGFGGGSGITLVDEGGGKFAVTGKAAVNGGIVNNTGGFNLNNTTFNSITGFTADLTDSTVSGAGNVAVPFSSNDGGGNAPVWHPETVKSRSQQPVPNFGTDGPKWPRSVAANVCLTGVV